MRGFPPGIRIEENRYGYWPSAEFMEVASCSIHNRFLPFSDFDKSRAGKRDDWVILCTVNGSKGPYTERRTVVYGEWETVDEPTE